MTDRLHHSVFLGHNLSENIAQGIAEADVCVTSELANRPARQPDLVSEMQALQTLAQQLMDDPQVMLKTLVGIAIERSQAGSAGISLWETAPNGESVFRWVAIAGALADLEQTTTPGDFSPCGSTLRSKQPQLYARPERYFTYLHHFQFPIVEALLIPLYVNCQPLGTLWLLSHDEARRFDLEDRRLMTCLAGFSVAALQSMILLANSENLTPQPPSLFLRGAGGIGKGEPLSPSPCRGGVGEGSAPTGNSPTVSSIRQQCQKAEDPLQREQEKSTAALRQSQELNQQILDSSDDCIKVLDLEGRILFMSPGGQALLGIEDITPFLNTSWADFWEGADRQAAIAAIAKARAGEVCTFEGHCPALTGEYKWWDSKISPIRDSKGQIERLLCISRDITDRKRSEERRKQAEERLRESEERLSAIFSQAAVGLSEISLDGHFQRVNDELCRILGRSREEMLTTGVSDVTHPEDVAKSLEAFQQLIKTGKPVSLDKRYQRPDGTIVWANSSLTRLDDERGHPHTVLAVTVDLSDRKQAQERLRESQERYRAIFNQAMTGVACTDLNGKLMLVNQKYCDITGYSAVELSQLRMQEITHSEDLPRNVELFNRMVAEGEPFEIEKRYIRKDGSLVWVNNKVSAICDREGKPQSVVAIVLDITSRKQAEAQFRQSEAKYRTLFNSIDEGFCLIEVLFDETGKAFDYRFLEANPAFEKHTGLVDAIGKTVRQLVPQHEAHWFEIYGEIALTGVPARFENSAAELGRFYDVYAFRVGEPHDRKVAVLFKDISDRKRREANLCFLAEISNDFSRLSTANEIMQVVGAKIGAYLKITTCNFTDVDEGQGEVTVHYGWNSTNVPSTVGTFRIAQYLSEEFKRASRAGETVVVRNTQTDPRTDGPGYAAFNMYSFVTVPFHRNGRWTHYIAICDSRPRDWRDDEIELIEEISNRIFPRLQRARTEAALRESEAKYRTLFESIDEGFCIVQLIFDENNQPIDWRYIEINPVFEQQTGMKNALGRTIREIVPNMEPSWFDIYGKVALTGEATRFVNRADSMGRWFDVYAFRVGEPHECKVAVLFNDISDRKQAEAEREQLLANERHYANQLQGLTAAALAINSALSVEEVLKVITDRAASIVGTHQSVASMTIDLNWSQAIDAIYLSDKYAAWQNYDEKPDGSGIYACVCHLNRPMRMSQAELEAHPHWKAFGKEADRHPPMRGWLAAPLVGRDGRNIGLLQLSDKYEGDFTQADESILVQLAQMASVAVENARLYEAEQQARSAAEASREEAQAANRVKDEFLAVLSHELRSPLNPILGWSSLLQSKKLDAATTSQALATIQRNAKLQSELIEDLLDVSRILRGKLSLNVAPVNLTSVIRGAMETVRLAAEAKSIKIEASLAPEVGLVSGDSTRLQQVVWNLLSNAVKFTPEGGRVNICLEHQEAHAYITIGDTGQGIEPDFLPYVFDYFRQADGATTRKFGGLGLGLAIVRHLVELHGGTVSAESPGLGMGATFTVRLPLMITQTTSNRNGLSSESSSDLNGIQVLIVDDEPDSREFVAFVLEQAGAKVITATNADEALTKLIRSKPDVLLSDIGMPDMDGYMLMQQLRSLPPEQGGQVPAIALTAYAGDFNQQQALQAGFQRHVSKPVEPEVLVSTIANLLN